MRVRSLTRRSGRPTTSGLSSQSGERTATSPSRSLRASLLTWACLLPPSGEYAGRPVEVITGKSLYALVTGSTDSVHPADEPIGYELGGNAEPERFSAMLDDYRSYAENNRVLPVRDGYDQRTQVGINAVQDRIGRGFILGVAVFLVLLAAWVWRLVHARLRMREALAPD